jgi:trimeric autotransporter adhesin
MSSTTQFYRNLSGLGNIGVGTTTAPSSNIQVTGNIYASNALTSANAFHTNAAVSSLLAIGGFALSTGGPTIGVTGNVYASNAFQTTTVLATSLIGTHYGVIAGSNTVSASTFTGSGASLTNLPLNQFTGLTAGGVAYGSATTTIATNSAGTSGQALLSGATGAPTWGTLGLANGGTGATSAQGAMNALAGAVTSGQYLRGNGTNVVMSAIQAADVPTLNQNTSGSSGSCTGNAATATTAAACSGNAATATTAAACSGNAATATTAAACSGNSATATTAAACSGNSATATTATNQSGGTVSATTISSTGAITVSNGSPTVVFSDTDQKSAFLHNNSNLFYILGGPIGAAYGGWAQVNGQWPATWDLTNNNVTMGGTVNAIGDIVAYASDERLKTKVDSIENALDKVCSLTAFKYIYNETAHKNGLTSDVVHVGLSAQEVQKVLPEVVKPAPFDVEIVEGGGVTKSRSGENYLTIQYERIVSLLVEALKEERAERLKLEERISQLELKETVSI